MQILSSIKQLSSRDRLFGLYAMICCFLICGEYAIVRPVANSLFLHAFGSSYFPHAWLATVPLSLLIVSLYNYLLPRWGCNKLFIFSVVAVIMGNIGFSYLFPYFPLVSFFLYIWKDVYILLMHQQLWSVVHATIPLDRAKSLYGVLLGIGGLGAICGSAFPGFCAVTYGSEKLLYLSLPFYLVLAFFYGKLLKVSAVDQLPKEEKKTTSLNSFLHGCQLIKRSRFLLFALLLVVLMQLASAILDFQFNDCLAKLFPDKDLRTEYSARLLSIGHVATIFLQFIGSYLFIRLIGLKNSHLVIPMALGLNGILYAIFPLFPLLSFSFMALKAFDFSIFHVLKEILYVPLRADEKFRAKAVIDVFAYRSAKAVAAFLIFAFQPVLTWVSIALFGIWIATIFWGFRDHERVSA